MNLTLIPLRSSFSEFFFSSTKLEPLSDLITSGIPRLAMKRLMELANDSPSILWATSKCMALVAKHA